MPFSLCVVNANVLKKLLLAPLLLLLHFLQNNQQPPGSVAQSSKVEELRQLRSLRGASPMAALLRGLLFGLGTNGS